METSIAAKVDLIISFKQVNTKILTSFPVR
jgi:hypothetical protein